MRLGRAIWSIAETKPSRELARAWLTWGLPDRCDSNARELTQRSLLLGQALGYNAKPPESPPAPDGAPASDSASQSPAPPDQPAASAAPAADAAPPNQPAASSAPPAAPGGAPPADQTATPPAAATDPSAGH